MMKFTDFKHRNLWQHSLWADFQEKAGRKTWQLNSKDASAVVIRHGLPMKLCWLEVPRGPLFESEEGLLAIMKEIKKLARVEGAVFIRFSSFEEFKIKNLKLKIATADHQPEASLILDLSLSQEELLAQMKSKGRYNIKVAQKHGVSVSESNNVDAFYQLLQKTGGRDGFGIHAKSYYQNMLESLGEHAQLLLAKQEDEVIAGGIFVYLDEWGIYYYGASDHAHRKMMAPYLVQWSAILEAKKRGCKHYDFLGIAPEGAENHAWAGVTSFKKKFGGKVVHFPKAREWVMRPFWYWVYRVYKRLRG